MPLSGSEGTAALSSTSTFTLTCSGAGGEARSSVTIDIASTPIAPTVTLSANPTSIASGTASTLTWSSTDATSCTASGGWTGTQATSGTQTTGTLTASTTYTLSCTGAGGTAQQSAAVTVNGAPPPPPPTVTISANPTSIASGAASTLTWSSTNATSCTASGGWTGTQTTSGSQSTGALTATTAYTLSCTGGGGTIAQSANVTVVPVPTVTFSANPTSIASGAASTLTWSSTNATSCIASGGWSGSKATGGSQSTGALTASTTYTLSCTGVGGTGQRSASVTVNAVPPPPAPTVTISANPTSIASGATSTLTWSSTNATSCTASGGWSGTKALSGTQTTGALAASTTYTLSCTGVGGTIAQSATVTVVPAPTVTIGANPTSIASGASSLLTWSSTNATSCTASGGWSGAKALSGTQTTGALSSSTTYTLSCTGVGGTLAQSATVTVVPAPTVTISANPTSVASGSSSMLTWSSTNATSCTASGGWSGAKATSGTQTTGALTTSTTYTLSCTGSGGTLAQSATVTVLPAPTVTISANPTSVASGAASTLTWSSTNAMSCTASGGWSGTVATAGTQSTGALTTSTTFTLSCTGAGGTASNSVLVSISTTSSIFPLHMEAGKRYLIDVSGHPFLIHGDTPWDLISTPTNAQADQYLEDRRLKGFNTVLVELMEHQFSPTPPYDAYGDAPFLTPGDFSTPNEAYFAHADWVINDALQKGILVEITPAYMGYAGGSEGWYQEMSANGATKLQAFGRYLANRFAAYPNILWVEGGDYNPPDLSLLNAIPNGIRQVNTVWLHTFHGARYTSALGFLGAGNPWLGLNDIYTDETDVVDSAFTEYNRSTMPFFLVEARYEGEQGAGDLIVRQQAYQTDLSGGAGQLMGNSPLWYFGSGWQTALNSAGAASLSYLRSLFEAHQWWLLQPDTNGTFLTGGAQSGSNQAVGAVASDGSFAMIYTPSVRGLTVNFGRLAGPNVNARWYNPISGVYGSISGSPFPASGSRTLTPSGSNDWVLVLESTP